MIVPQERRGEDQCHHTESKRNQAVLTDLRRATPYEVQVRVHTEAGYGSFSPASVFHTLPDGEEKTKKKHSGLQNISEEIQIFLLSGIHFCTFSKFISCVLASV